MQVLSAQNKYRLSKGLANLNLFVYYTSIKYCSLDTYTSIFLYTSINISNIVDVFDPYVGRRNEVKRGELVM